MSLLVIGANGVGSKLVKLKEDQVDFTAGVRKIVTVLTFV